jgi:O-glycosyl hydrolase
MRRLGSAGLVACVVAVVAATTATRQSSPAGEGQVLSPDAHLTTPVTGLERTNGESKIVPVTGQTFSNALQVVVRQSPAETNATQLTLPIAEPVRAGDVLLASFWLRGRSADGKAPARIEFLFERSESPWTKSATYGAASARDGATWRRVMVPIRSAETYAARQAMVSLRFALQPQTVEVGGLSVRNYGKTRTLDQLVEFAVAQNPVGPVRVKIDLKATRQTIEGFGGNFAQPRYGSTEPMDVVGRYALENLNVVHARIGLPLNSWNPEPGVFRDDAQARASLLALQEMGRRRLPTVVSVWEGPGWMLGGKPEQMGRTLPPEMYDECIEAVGRYLVTARDKYGVHADYFSFNEPDYGVNFKFTPKEMADFIRQAGPRFAALGLRTKFLVGDTANGTNFYAYALPQLQDKTIARYLGPLAFHNWDVLSASDTSYTRIAELGRRFKKPVWCLEAGHDAQLWQAPNPWGTWENALRTAMAYERTIRLSGASLMDYWTYQDNYPLVDKEGPKPYPVFHVVKQMEAVFRPGTRVAMASSEREEIQALATVGRNPREFAVLLVNSAGAGTVTLSGLPAGSKVKIVTSDKSAQLQAEGTPFAVDAKGNLQVTMPVRSVVTVLGQR